jgi:UDP-N-acetylglucosamine 3-dehydrogenase
MRILLIGLGRWGERHLRVLQELGVEVWVADVVEERLSRARRSGVDPARLVVDYRAALAGVDAVDIVTPADSHLTLALACLAAGRDCFIEKPVTLTAREAQILVLRAEATGRVVQVGHIFRFHPVTDALHAALAAERIGPVRYVAGRFAGFKRPRIDVGVTGTDAIHYFDLFGALLHRDATAVTATTRDFLGRGLEDLAFATVEYGETPAFIEAGYFVPGRHRDCVIVGERGSLMADFGQATVTAYTAEHRRAGLLWEAIEAGKEELPVVAEEPLRRELAAFCTSVTTRTRPLVDAAAGLSALEIVEAAQRSASLGRRVRLDEVRSVLYSRT